MNEEEDVEWLTPAQAAIAKNVTRQAITKAIREKRLPGRNWGRLYLIRRSDLATWTPGPQGKRKKGE